MYLQNQIKNIHNIEKLWHSWLLNQQFKWSSNSSPTVWSSSKLFDLKSLWIKSASLIYTYLHITIYNIPAASDTIHQNCLNRMRVMLIQRCFPIEMQYVWVFFFLFKSISMKLHPAYFSASFTAQIWRRHHLRPHTGISSHVRIQQAHQLSVIQCLCAGVCVCVHMCARRSGFDIDVLSASGRAVEWSGNSNHKQRCLFPHRPEYNIMSHFFPSLKQRPECYSELQRLLGRVQRSETSEKHRASINGWKKYQIRISVRSLSVYLVMGGWRKSNSAEPILSSF